MTAQQVTHDIFDAVSDATRRRIMELLVSGEMSVAAIKEEFSISRTAINKHLQTLYEAGVVSRRRIGKETRYSLDARPLTVLIDWVSYFEQYWEDRLSDLRESVESGK